GGGEEVRDGVVTAGVAGSERVGAGGEPSKRPAGTARLRELHTITTRGTGDGDEPRLTLDDHASLRVVANRIVGRVAVNERLFGCRVCDDLVDRLDLASITGNTRPRIGR